MATVNDVTVSVRRNTAASTRPVVIVGAGIQGCATAFFLSQRGQSVIVLDKDHVGRHASGVNAGGVRRLGRDINEIPLSLAAMDWWHQIDQLLDIEDGFHQQFYVKVALDDAGANLAGSRIQQLEKAGFKHEIWVEPEQLHRRIPHLTKSILGVCSSRVMVGRCHGELLVLFMNRRLNLVLNSGYQLACNQWIMSVIIGRLRLMLVGWRRIM